jgi:hypothetical protein
MAHFWFAGSRDDSIEALQMDVTTGVSWLVSFFTSQVGTGSRSQCLVLLLESIFLTSSSVTDQKEDSFVSVIRGVITGGWAFAVNVLIACTFDVNWWANWFTDRMSELSVAADGDRREFTFDQIAFRSPEHNEKFDDQNWRAFRWNSLLIMSPWRRQARRLFGVGQRRSSRSSWRVFFFAARHSESNQRVDLSILTRTF